MDNKEFLLRALNQEHPESKQDFLAYIESVFGTGLLFDLYSKMIDKYGLPKIGTRRATYISKSIVFKVPVDIEGFRENDWEGSLCAINPDSNYEIPIAKSRLIFCDDIPVVAMEKVQPLFLSQIKEKFGEIPAFVSWVDMGQVGLNRQGKLVAYDYADL